MLIKSFGAKINDSHEVFLNPFGPTLDPMMPYGVIDMIIVH